VEVLPPTAASAQRRHQRWGGLGPFLIKVEENPDEFIEEVVDPPARVPVLVRFSLVVCSISGTGVKRPPSLQESCIVHLYQEEEEDSSYQSCEELLLAICLIQFSQFL
jgi:hypothetical protein